MAILTTEREPNFFLIGAGRSGTTFLADLLGQHPDVFLTDPKEPHFLALADTMPDFKGPGDDVTVNRLSVTRPMDYRALYETARETARGDASVSTLYYAERSLANLEKYFPSARVVAVFREPVERAYSAYSYLRVRGFEKAPSFQEAVAQELRGERRRWQHLWQYIDMGRYGSQLRPFIETLGPDRVHVTFYDWLSRDPVAVAQGVFRFLGVEDGRDVAVRRVNASGRVRSDAVQRTIRWAGRQRGVRPMVRAVVPFTVRERLKGFNLAPEDRPHIADDVRELFVPELVAFRNLLAQHYGEDVALPGWLGEPS